MSTLYDISCIVFQDSLLPMHRSYEGVTSLSAVVCRRWSGKRKDGVYDYVVVSSFDATDQGLDQHGIEWVKVSDPETSAIVELFVASKVEEHTHVFVDLDEGSKCACGLEGTDHEARREAARAKYDAACAECEVPDAKRLAAWDEYAATL
jgi:hypothetical protein